MPKPVTTALRAGSRSHGVRRGERTAGWLFSLPVIVILGVFLVIPVIMAIWVSFSDWTGRGSPFSTNVSFVGVHNYAAVATGGGLAERNFGMAIRNNAWYVILVVPIQTVLSLLLAVLVNRSILRGRSLFRTAFYFPSVTSSVAITVLWLFLFSTGGVINKVLSWFGVNGPNWFNDPRGIVHVALGSLGVDKPPPLLSSHGLLGIDWWEWLSGPSFAMTAFILMAVFTTSGTFMLLFLAALQAISPDLDEAGAMDGANGWQRFWRITLPQLRPTLFTVLTLGLISTWQVFDQIYTGTQGGPGKTTLTPAYLSYQTAFVGQRWGEGSAIAFILFVVIIILTLLQRMVLRERSLSNRRSFYRQAKGMKP
jgi:multiple sugar transport system permease protein